MANYNQAPRLAFKGEKMPARCQGFYQIPQELADIIFKEYSTKPAYIRLLLVLCGTKPGFALSEQWVLDRCGGMGHKTYCDVKKDLVNRGWLIVGNGEIIVNFDAIYGSQKIDVLSEHPNFVF